MDRVSLTASAVGLVAFATRMCTAISSLRSLCKTLPGRIHAVSNEVADFEPVLLQLAGLLETSRQSPETWRNEQARLKELQDDIRSVKSSLNIMLGASNSLQGPQEALSTNFNGDAKGAIEPRQRQRTFSTGEESMLRSLQLKERLLYTIDFQNKGFKPNTRGHSIQDTLATLDELLLKLPEDMGFNIEMKYPRVHEAIEAGVAPVIIDINTFVDTALEKLERLAGRRPIILSSFTPEICILLSLKQSTYPVMFVTNAGKVPMADKELRAASLLMAVQFARRWNLDGIVLACETFVHCPRFIKFVQNADIIIADKVKLIADELNKEITG
ncbi:Glycerophosphoryl diester phosphodiesterase [Akanthomyces lecanii RCEF 1005]|uniref:Glycerophosphoryl diester phosphodiesterase n=1 Tax=Akanthomyces lecanii RCEF 1005 TaxID=1081108 RepID=A0A168IU00_CORDF|nr:Glycerophosphoryl diester phosphodiesterase [Akanthomyces lecanii RCEF 1005]